MQSLKTNTKALTIAAGAAAIVSGLLYLYKKLGEDSMVKGDEPFALSSSEKAILLDKVPVESENGHLSLSTMTKILGATLKFASPSHKKMLKESRSARRESIDDHEVYEEICRKYVGDTLVLIKEVQKEVIDELGISLEDWEDSFSYHVGLGRQDLGVLQASLPSHLRMIIEPTRDLSLEECKEVFRTQIKMFQKEVNETLNDQRNKESSKLTVITTTLLNRVNDKLHFEFGTEEEDILAALKKYNKDPELRELVQQLQVENGKLKSRIPVA